MRTEQPRIDTDGPLLIFEGLDLRLGQNTHVRGLPSGALVLTRPGTPGAVHLRRTAHCTLLGNTGSDPTVESWVHLNAAVRRLTGRRPLRRTPAWWAAAAHLEDRFVERWMNWRGTRLPR